MKMKWKKKKMMIIYKNNNKNIYLLKLLNKFYNICFLKIK